MANFVITENKYCCNLIECTPDTLVAGTIVFTTEVDAGDTGNGTMNLLRVDLTGASDFNGNTGTLSAGGGGGQTGDVSIATVTAGTYTVTVTASFSDTSETCVLAAGEITVV